MAKSTDTNIPTSVKDFAARALTMSVIFVSVLALAVLVWYSIPVLLMIFAGVLLAILLHGLAEGLSEYTGIKLGWSLIIVFLGIFVLLGLLVWLAAPSLIRQATFASEELPRAFGELKARMQSHPLGEKILRVTPSAKTLMGGRSDLFGSVTGMVSGVLGAVVTLLVIMFTALYLALDPRLYIRGILHLVPRARRQRIGETMGAVGYSLKWWLIAQAIDMFIIAAATAFGLWLLGVPMALLFGVLAGLFNFIPNFGPLISMIPAALIALTIGPDKALYVVILFVVLQNLEGNVLLPLLQRRAADLPPAVTIMAQVLLGLLAGGLGLALATPLAVGIMVAVKMLYVEDVIGDEIKTPADGEAHEEVREVQQSVRATKKPQKSVDDHTD